MSIIQEGPLHEGWEKEAEQPKSPSPASTTTAPPFSSLAMDATFPPIVDILVHLASSPPAG